MADGVVTPEYDVGLLQGTPAAVKVGTSRGAGVVLEHLE